MAKLAALLLLAGGFGQHAGDTVTLVSLPAAVWRVLGPVLFWGAMLCLWCNQGVRVAAATLGVLTLLVQLDSLPAARASAWLGGCLLVLCALQAPRQRPHLVRWFVIATCLAALLGATRGAGWVAVALGEPWMHGDFTQPILRWAARLLPAGWLAAWLQAATFVVPALLAVGLALPATRKWAVWTGLIASVALYGVLGGDDVALFVATFAVAHIAFLRWPREICVMWPRACGWPLWLRIAFDRYDWEQRTDWPNPPDPDADLEVLFDGDRVGGGRAICDLVLYFPPFYFMLLLVFGLVHASPAVIAWVLDEPYPFGGLLVVVAASINVLLAAALFAMYAKPTVGRLRRRLATRRAAAT